MSLVLLTLTVLGGLVLVPLCGLGLHRVVLVVRRLRMGRPRPAATTHRLVSPPPLVTIQLPLYNERRVARRVIAAAAAIDYPRDRFEMQVLDDSDDETTAICRAACEELRSRGVAIRHLQRDGRPGFKAGALQYGLERSRGDLIAVFDADFLPPADFLQRLVPMMADPDIGMIQMRWGHANRKANLLTRLQGLLLDGHFLLESAVRQNIGAFFNFNGTAGIWRREAILAAGGWSAQTLTEDLDLSYRAQLAGYRFLFVEAPAVPGELPMHMSSFRTQQQRWTQGSVQVGKKLSGRLLRAPLQPRVKCEALLHLWSNLAFPLLLLLSLLLPTLLWVRVAAGINPWWLDLPVLGIATLPVVAFYGVSLFFGGQRGPWALFAVPGVMALGIGMSVNNTIAVLSGCFGRPSAFLRTPKWGANRQEHRPYPLPRVSAGAVELLLCLYYLATCVWAASQGLFAALPFLALFVFGFGLVGWLSVREQLA